MSDLIDRQAAIDAPMSLTVYKSKREVVQAADKHENTWIGGVAECIDEIEDLPSAQHKPDEQIMWERDTAIQQLKELGYGLGEKIRMDGDTISRQAAIDAYIMKCPYFSGKNTIDRSEYGTHIGSCDLEFHYRKVCPSNECLCAERLGLKNG